MGHDRPRASKGRRRRATAAAASLAVHALLLSVVLRVAPEPPVAADTEMSVTLAPMPPAPQIPKPQVPKASAPAKASPPRAAATAEPKRAPKRKPPPKQRLAKALIPSPVPPRLVAKSEVETPIPDPQVSAADLASAVTADSEGAGAGEGSGTGGGGRGGRCDMVRRLQHVLREDVRVRAAVAQARAQGGSGAIVVWNGDWVRRSGEDGKGLAGLRQAISVEVAFAPKPCREQAMRGLVLLSLEDGPGASRIVLGSSAWRWSDLLFVR
jgi:hypothetical protein